MITKLLAIAGNTFLETIRQPIYGIILILTGMMMVLNTSLSAYTLSDDNMFLRDLGLSTLLVSGLFLASFSAAGVLYREISNKTVVTILSKPVTKPILIAGKYLGLIGALFVAYYISTIVMLLTVRHGVLQTAADPWNWPVIIFGSAAVFFAITVAAVGNYWYGWQFSSTAITLVTVFISIAGLVVAFVGVDWKFQRPMSGSTPNLLSAILLVLLMVWIITAVALAVSCKYGQVATLTTCVVLLMLGLTSDYFFGQHQLAGMGFMEQPTISSKFCWIAYRLIPNLGVFWVADALNANKDISFGYLATAVAYALLYITTFLFMGLAIFQKREVG